MEQNQKIGEPDNTAIITALWRGLHVQADPKPHIIEDEIGIKLINPPHGWQHRPNMIYTKRLQAAIIARARFIEDLVIEQSRQGISQYVILGAGLDTFAQRRPDICSKLQVYEIDQPDTLAWKHQRLIDLGLGIPNYLHFVHGNFETSTWWEHLLKAGFNMKKPVVVACTGVTLYLSKETVTSMINKIVTFASGSTLAMTFYLPIELLDERDKSIHSIGEKGVRDAGTPYISFFQPDEILALAREAGFKEKKIISTKEIGKIYFKDRTEHNLPASGEVFLLAIT